ncbi:MAG: hypothetical protein AAGD88_12075 [Bacteroidota bacterium]
MRNLYLLTITMLFISLKSISQATDLPSPNQIDWDTHFEIIFSDFEDNIKGKITRNGEKAVLSKDSESVNFEAFDLEKNGVYIEELFTLFEMLDEINDDIGILDAFGQNSFYTSFRFCGCTETPKKIIELYQTSWQSLSTTIDGIQTALSPIATTDTRKINALIEVIKGEKGTINSSEILRNRNWDDYAEIESYILEDVFPENSIKVKKLKVKINELKTLLTSYATFVKIYN